MFENHEIAKFGTHRYTIIVNVMNKEGFLNNDQLDIIKFGKELGFQGIGRKIELKSFQGNDYLFYSNKKVYHYIWINNDNLFHLKFRVSNYYYSTRVVEIEEQVLLPYFEKFSSEIINKRFDINSIIIEEENMTKPINIFLSMDEEVLNGDLVQKYYEAGEVYKEKNFAKDILFDDYVYDNIADATDIVSEYGKLAINPDDDSIEIEFDKEVTIEAVDIPRKMSLRIVTKELNCPDVINPKFVSKDIAKKGVVYLPDFSKDFQIQIIDKASEGYSYEYRHKEGDVIYIDEYDVIVNEKKLRQREIKEYSKRGCYLFGKGRQKSSADFCFFNSNSCADDEYCSLFMKCKKVRCENGYVENHKCVKYDCIEDKNCKKHQVCTNNKCVDSDDCIKIEDNGDSKTKIDVVFVGDGYTDNKELIEDVERLIDENDEFNGLFSIEPYKSNKKKFNFWVVKAPKLKHNEVNFTWCREDALKEINKEKLCEEGRMGRNRDGHIVCNVTQNKPDKYDDTYIEKCSYVDYSVIISKDTFYRSYASRLYGYAHLSLACEMEEYEGRLLLHEFGHSFGELRDEYVESVKGDRSGAPNCASSKKEAVKLWGDIAKKYEDVGYYSGCAYIKENVKPTLHSIMNDHNELRYDYGRVNERAIEEQLNEFK